MNSQYHLASAWRKGPLPSYPNDCFSMFFFLMAFEGPKADSFGMCQFPRVRIPLHTFDDVLAINSQPEAFPGYFFCWASSQSWPDLEMNMTISILETHLMDKIVQQLVVGMASRTPLVECFKNLHWCKGFWPCTHCYYSVPQKLLFVQREVCKSTRRWRLRWQVVMWSHDVARHAAKHRTREGWCLGLSWCRCAGLLESESC